MGVARGGLGLGVAEDSPNHRQALAPHHRLRGKRVSEIVDAHIAEPGRLAHPPPRLLQIGQMRAFGGPGDDIGITLDPLGSSQHLERRPVEGDRLGAGLGASKTGPRTLWFGPDAAKLVSSLPRRGEDERVFPDELTPSRLYAVWTRLRAEAGLDDVRIHDLRHSFASQGVMNGEGLPTVGRLLGHRRRATTAIYAHLDDATLQDAAARAAGVIAQAMEFKVEGSLLSSDEEESHEETGTRQERYLVSDLSREGSGERNEKVFRF